MSDGKKKAGAGILKKKPMSAMDMPDVPKQEGVLPPHIELQRTRVTCKTDINEDVKTYISSGSYASYGFDNSLDLEAFRRQFQVSITSLNAEDITFEMTSLDPAIANAFRRIVVAEVPTLAIEKVYIINNTSMIQDEVLAHRLGLVPIAADPRKFTMRGPEDEATESNTVVLRLKARCAAEATSDGSRRVQNESVYSASLEWLPEGSQLPLGEPHKFTQFAHSQTTVAGPAGVRPVQSDILLIKMRPGQEVELEAHAIKGVGGDHAKWSPVGTAWYQLVPEVVLLQDPITGAEAARLAGLCPKKCFGLGPRGEAVVRQVRGCDLCRERVRALSGEEGWGDRIALRKIKDHYIFTLESTGALPPEEVFVQAVDALAEKCRKVLASL